MKLNMVGIIKLQWITDLYQEYSYTYISYVQIFSYVASYLIDHNILFPHKRGGYDKQLHNYQSDHPYQMCGYSIFIVMPADLNLLQNHVIIIYILLMYLTTWPLRGVTPHTFSSTNAVVQISTYYFCWSFHTMPLTNLCYLQYLCSLLPINSSTTERYCHST